MLRVTGLSVRLEEDDGALGRRLAEHLGVPVSEIDSVEVVRRSLDARKKSGFYFVYTLNVALKGSLEKSGHILGLSSVKLHEEPVMKTFKPFAKPPVPRPVVVGMGPAGLFAALVLARAGAAPLVLERGAELGKRVRDVRAFWDSGVLDTDSNVQFGEGGAGTFSDGKLTTRINDPRVKLVLKTLVGFGAPEDVMYDAKPHVGTDRLRAVLLRFRKALQELGAEIRFGTKLEDVEVKGGRISALFAAGQRVDANHVVLAPGNAARDTFEMLKDAGVAITAKPFALGVRVEHPRELIDKIQYGRYAGNPRLGAADYMLTYTDRRSGRAVYSFCMCPGGRVIAASSEEHGMVVNGMSDHKRDGRTSNSALVVTVGPDDFGTDGPLGGVLYQRAWERDAYVLGGGGYIAPAQDMESFMAGRPGGNIGLASCRPGVEPTDLRGCLPGFAVDALKRALPEFDRKMKGFVHPRAVLTGVETRTSSPVRIIRGDDHQSVSVRGLFPCGEGSGYAGGIVSSAVDGIKAAEKLLEALTH